MAAAVDLYWLPLGAGGHFVRLNGRIYEQLAGWIQRRPAHELYRVALQVEVPEGRRSGLARRARTRCRGGRRPPATPHQRHGLRAAGARADRQVPTPVWGRDELGTGDMWNSNSVISWAIACGGLDADDEQRTE